jgi:hypothetical protein
VRNDQPIDEVRDVRHRISARFEHDPALLVDQYMKIQERYEDRLIDPSHSEKDLDRSLYDNPFTKSIQQRNA